MIFNTLPVFLGKTAESLDLSIAEAGWLGSIYLSGFGLASVVASLFLHRANRRGIAWLAFLVAAGLLLLASTAESYAAIAALLFATGLALGTLYSLSFILASEFHNATRAVGIKLGGEVVLGAALIFILPVAVYPAFGLEGMLVSLALVLLCFSVSAATLPPASASTEATSAEKAPMPMRASLGLFALFIFTVSQAALWSFAERAGIERGIDNVALGSALSLAVLFGGVGAFLAALVSDKAGRRLPIGVAFVAYAFAIGLFLFGGELISYALAVNLFFLVWLFALPYFISAIGEADASGRAVTLVTACLAFGSMLGPVTGVFLIGIGGYGALYVIGAGLTLGAFSILLASPSRCASSR